MRMTGDLRVPDGCSAIGNSERSLTALKDGGMTKLWHLASDLISNIFEQDPRIRFVSAKKLKHVSNDEPIALCMCAFEAACADNVALYVLESRAIRRQSWDDLSDLRLSQKLPSFGDQESEAIK
jgi:hypothetical protein